MEDSRHTITLDNREKLTVTGVSDILSYDDENIFAHTEDSALIIRGYNLHITSFDQNKGLLIADGNISSLTYDNDTGSTGGFFRKLFK